MPPRTSREATKCIDEAKTCDESGAAVNTSAGRAQLRIGSSVVWSSNTSCAADSEGYFLGQAFVYKRYAKKGTLVYIYQDVEKRKGTELTDLSYGERVALPDTATILKRFHRF